MRPPCFWPEMTAERGPNNTIRLRNEQARDEQERTTKAHLRENQRELVRARGSVGAQERAVVERVEQTFEIAGAVDEMARRAVSNGGWGGNPIRLRNEQASEEQERPGALVVVAAASVYLLLNAHLPQRILYTHASRARIYLPPLLCHWR